MGDFIIPGLIVVAWVAILVAACWGALNLFDFGYPILGTLVACAIVFYIAVTIMWLATSSGNRDGYHEWPGGSGPATVCDYETKRQYNPATKVSEPRTWTVCRDAR